MGIFPLLFLLSSLALLSFASPVTLDSISLETLEESPRSSKPLTLYGRKTSMVALLGEAAVRNKGMFRANRKRLLLLAYDYDDLDVPSGYQSSLIDISDLDQSRADLMTDGINYIERDFNRENQRFAEIPGSDTPTAIAKNLLHTDKKLAVILGEPGSGKTLALTKILSLLRASRTITWSIMVDLKKAVPHPLPIDWSPSQIFAETLGPTEREILHEVLAYSPEKVNIILDNLNAVAGTETKQRIYRYVRGYNNRGAGLVISMTPNIGQSIAIPTMKEISHINGFPEHSYIEIPPLSTREVLLFLTRQLTAQFHHSTAFKPKYAEVIAIVIKNTPIPKNFMTIKQLVDLIISGDKSGIMSDEFQGLQDYLKTEKTSPQEFERILKAVQLNKMKLYEKFTDGLIPSQEAATHFGLQALNRILYPSESSEKMTLARQKDDIYYIGNGEEFTLLRHLQRDSIFIHPEYDQFFAAKVLVDKFKSSGIPEYQKIRVLTDPTFFRLLEFINAGISVDEESRKNWQRLFHSISQDGTELVKALNLAVLHKFDTVAAGLFREMVPQGIRQYLRFTYEIKRPPKQISFSYNLGMIKGDNPPYYYRQNMLFKNAMEQSIQAINTKQQSMRSDEMMLWRFEDLDHYMDDCVLSDMKLSWRKMQLIFESTPTAAITEDFLNNQLLKVVKHGGRGSFDIVKELISRGAVPSKVNVDGTTVIHAALGNLDLPQLQYFIEELNVPIIDVPKGKSLLIPILDANPLPYASPPNFWQVMRYIQRKSGGMQLPAVDSLELSRKTVIPKRSDKSSSIYQLLTGSVDSRSIVAARSRLQDFPDLLNKLSSPVRHYRRNYILSTYRKIVNGDHDETTMTEILLKYRGLDTLSDREHAAFENSITFALKADVGQMENGYQTRFLTEEQIRRIQNTLLDNIGTKGDFDHASQFVKIDLSHVRVPAHYIFSIHDELINQYNEKIRREPLRPPKISLKSGVLQTRFQIYPPPVVVDTIGERQEVPPVRNNLKTIAVSLLCGTLRRQRRDTSSCLTTDEEYRKIVKETVENGENIRKIRTEQFLDLLTITEEKGQTEKINELISIGRELLEKGAMLDGNNQMVVRQILLPKDIQSQTSVGPFRKEHLDVFGHESYRPNSHQDGSGHTNVQVHSPRTGISRTQLLGYKTYGSGMPERQNGRVGYPFKVSDIQRPNYNHLMIEYDPLKVSTLEKIGYKSSSLSRTPVSLPKFVPPKFSGGRNGRK